MGDRDRTRLHLCGADLDHTPLDPIGEPGAAGQCHEALLPGRSGWKDGGDLTLEQRSRHQPEASLFRDLAEPFGERPGGELTPRRRGRRSGRGRFRRQRRNGARPDRREAAERQHPEHGDAYEQPSSFHARRRRDIEKIH